MPKIGHEFFLNVLRKLLKNNYKQFKKKTKELNWKLLKNIKNKSSLILSGALSIKNLEEATKFSNIKFCLSNIIF